MLSLVRVCPLPITVRVGTLYPEVVNLQPHSIVRESVAERDLFSVIGADIVTRLDDWCYTLQTEPMPTGRLWRRYSIHHHCTITHLPALVHIHTWNGFFRTHRQIAHLRYSWTSSMNISSGSSSAVASEPGVDGGLPASLILHTDLHVTAT